MSRPVCVTLAMLADYANLAAASHRAARGKRNRPEVKTFIKDVTGNLNRLRAELLCGEAPSGHLHQFTIHDPKQRLIQAPCFRDRIVHHALIHQIGPVLDRCLLDGVNACRIGKGAQRAARAVCVGLQRYPWFVRIDMTAYFASIRHNILRAQLKKRLKGRRLFPLIDKILMQHGRLPGVGLSFGALTSQHLANFYLNGFDRFLVEDLKVRGYVRYMDDVIWWCHDRHTARQSLQAARTWVAEERALVIKAGGLVGCSNKGVTFCGFRIRRNGLGLSRRRLRRYRLACRRLRRRAGQPVIGGGFLQQRLAAARSILAGADCLPPGIGKQQVLRRTGL